MDLQDWKGKKKLHIKNNSRTKEEDSITDAKIKEELIKLCN